VACSFIRFFPPLALGMFGISTDAQTNIRDKHTATSCSTCRNDHIQ
jgi:hypothetical protein